MRRYENGVLVGEEDPPPSTTIEQWLTSELKLVEKKGLEYERDRNWSARGVITGRASALRETLYQLHLRE